MSDKKLEEMAYETLEMIEEQIDRIRMTIPKGMSMYALQNRDGSYVMAGLLHARATALHALALAKREKVEDLEAEYQKFKEFSNRLTYEQNREYLLVEAARFDTDVLNLWIKDKRGGT